MHVSTRPLNIYNATDDVEMQETEKVPKALCTLALLQTLV